MPVCRTDLRSLCSVSRGSTAFALPICARRNRFGRLKLDGFKPSSLVAPIFGGSEHSTQTPAIALALA